MLDEEELEEADKYEVFSTCVLATTASLDVGSAESTVPVEAGDTDAIVYKELPFEVLNVVCDALSLLAVLIENIDDV